jgi:hypothetical protein
MEDWLLPVGTPPTKVCKFSLAFLSSQASTLLTSMDQHQNHRLLGSSRKGRKSGSQFVSVSVKFYLSLHVIYMGITESSSGDKQPGDRTRITIRIPPRRAEVGTQTTEESGIQKSLKVLTSAHDSVSEDLENLLEKLRLRVHRLENQVDN